MSTMASSKREARATRVPGAAFVSRILRPDRAAAPPRVVLPGDELLPHARAEATHEVDLAAPPAEVWPWLVQMGRGRGGWYSWDRLDNGGVPSADHVIPALQRLAVGDTIPIKPRGPEGFTVLVLDAPRALVLGDPSLLPGRAAPPEGTPRATWAFALEPLGEQATRLRVRVRADYRPGLTTWVLRWLVAGLHEIMERKQLRTLQQRVARAGAPRPAPAPPGSHVS
jgi:proline iminopeptidase